MELWPFSCRLALERTLKADSHGRVRGYVKRSYSVMPIIILMPISLFSAHSTGSTGDDCNEASD